MAIGAIAASTLGQMAFQEADRRRAANAEAAANEGFNRKMQELEGFKYTNPQAYADQVAEAEKIAGAAAQAGDYAIRSGIQQNIEAASRDPRMAPQAASAVEAGGNAAFQNMLREAQYSMPYRQRLADVMGNTQRMNEQFQLGLDQMQLNRQAAAAEAARQEKRYAQQEMGNALLTGVSQGIDVRNANMMDKLYRDLYGTSTTSGASSDSDAFLRNARANMDALNSRMDDTFAKYRTGGPSGTEAVSEPISDFSAPIETTPIVNAVEEAPTVDTAELQRSLSGLGSLPGSDGSGFGMDNSVMGLQLPRLEEGFLNRQAVGPRAVQSSFNTDLNPSFILDGFYPGGLLDVTNPTYRYNVPNQEEGGDLPMMTPGEPSHETNEQRLIDRQTGAPVADLTGAETVINHKDTADIEELVEENDAKGLLKFMKRLLSKPQFKKQREENGHYQQERAKGAAPQAPGPGGQADPRMAIMQAMMGR